ncbi:MAG TPA: preprotein translocase subunit SecE [Candidatus Paceibacterota bacterium]|nr:preprotein translocase subunit SecE [Candidatus Paceibacterota bacterium]
MAGIGQYFKDTRTELNHVAWPTQRQTVVYTILVVAISIGIAVYLGLFDYVFTVGLSRIVNANQSQQTQQTAPATQTNTAQAPSFTLPGATTTK